MTFYPFISIDGILIEKQQFLKSRNLTIFAFCKLVNPEDGVKTLTQGVSFIGKTGIHTVCR